MRQTSYTLDLTSLDGALTSFRTALEITSSSAFQTLEEGWQETLIAGVVQNFEFTFELAWKMLKRQLELDLPNASELDTMSYRDLIRTGYEKGLIDDPEKWFDYRLLRNITSHGYDRRKALQVYEGAAELFASASFLFEKLKARNDANF
ncbi:MAG TPA: hypothetical protein ENK26_12930 [Gammaproteobacteria bacterium]|nr:hypothetical protein [Gammaproteobacteria bacterium]